MTVHQASYKGVTPNQNHDIVPEALCGELKVSDRVTSGNSIFTVDCPKCIYIETRDRVEKELHEAGIIEDPDMDGGLLG